MAAAKKRKLGWKAVAKSLGKPKVAVMLALGFSSGLPFMLVGNTLSYWLRDSGVTLATIGFLSWVGLAYSFKFLWAPITDKVAVPILGRLLGPRRSWMIVTQILVAAALMMMAFFGPEAGIAVFTGLAALAAFGSATQDIVIDAWRIEISDDGEEMAMLSSAYQLGYRIALLLTDALILIVAGRLGWSLSYTAMGVVMGVGLIATLCAREPKRETVVHDVPKLSLRGVFDAVAGPLIAFFEYHGRKAILILAAVSLYRLADFVMGPMANPFYADLGFSKEMVGAVRGSVGLVASFSGVAVGGLCAVRFGLMRTLLIGAVIGPSAILSFSILALVGPRPEVFAAAMFIDNFANGFAGVALVGYMSTLTSLGYTATQYALLSSFYTLSGKFLKGFSGVIVDSLAHHYPLLEAYAIFFAGTAVIGIPAVILCTFLARPAPR